jgi:hypothetical protein
MARSTCDVKVNVGFEVLTAVVMKSSILWDIAPCFTEICRLHLQGRISGTRYQRESTLQVEKIDLFIQRTVQVCMKEFNSQGH